MKLPLIFFCTCLSSCLSAQITLSGTVFDSGRHPLSGANIILQLGNDSYKNQATTNEAGGFHFSSLNKGDYHLTITYTGYRENVQAIPISRDTSVAIMLGQKEEPLTQVVVTATRSTIQNDRERTIYNVSSSTAAAGSDALTALGQVPGIKISDNEIGIAGKGQVKVMVNNRLVNLAGLDLVRYLRSVSANQIAKIEVIKNPSAAFDAEGNAGLINITTKRSAAEGFSGSVQGSYKSWRHNPNGIFRASDFWMTNANASLNYNAARWSAYATLSEDEDHELEGFETDIFYPKQRWLQTDTGDYVYHNYAITAGVDYELSDRATIGVSYLGGKAIYDGNDHVNNPVYNLSGTLDSNLRTYATYHPVALNNAFNLHSIVTFDSAGKKLSLNADYFDYDRNDRSDFESMVYLPNGKISEGSRTRYFDTNKQKIGVYTFKADLDIPASFGSLSFGVKLSFINNYSNAFYYDRDSSGQLTYNTSLSNEFRYIENTQAAYGNLSGAKNKWTYAAGLRAEYTHTNGHAYVSNQTTLNDYLRLFPTLSLSFQDDSANNFGLNIGRRINRPSFWNLNPYKSLYTAFSYVQGNPFLQPEYNINFELSHTYRSVLTSGIFLNITDNGFNNVTIGDPNSNIVTVTPLNFIKTYRIGISETVSWHISPRIDNNAQATLYHTDARSRLNYIEGIHGFGAYLSTGFTGYLNAAKTLAGAVSFWYQFPEVDHIGRSDSYYRLDAGLQAQLFQKKLSLALNLNDAFRSSASAVTTTVNGLRTKFTNFQLNRFFQLSMGYRLGHEHAISAKETGNEEERRRSGL